MNKQTLAVAGSILGAVVLGSAPASWAAPASSSMTALKQATFSDATNVYYRRYYGRRYYPGVAIGLGILGAAAGAAAIAGSGYYGPGYGYGAYHEPAYGYVEPGYGYVEPGYHVAPGYYGNPYRGNYYNPY